MKNSIKLITTVFSLLFSSLLQANYIHFGETVNTDKLTPISSVLANPEQYLTKPATIKGRVVSVCEKKGCWMKLKSDQAYQKIKLKVKDGDMVFPLSARGKLAVATGTLKKVEYSVEQRREMMVARAEKKGKAFDPATITEPLITYQMTPTGVTIIE